MGRGRDVGIVAGLVVLVAVVVSVGFAVLHGDEAGSPPEKESGVDRDGRPTRADDIPDLAAGTTPATGPGAAPEACATPAAPGESAAAPEDRAPERTPGRIGVLAGRVVARNGEAIEGAGITITYDSTRGGPLPEGAPRLRATKTDTNGEFRFEDVPAGTWRVHASHPRFAARSLTGIRLSPEAGIEGMSIPLVGGGGDSGLSPDAGAVEGTVTDRSGGPVVGARINVSGSEGGRHEIRTDEDGKFRVAPLSPGRYQVELLMVAPDGAEEAAGSRRKTRFVTVTPGKAEVVDFTGSGRLSGVVLDEAGYPMAGVIVRIAPTDIRGGYRPDQARTGADGRFVIDDAGEGPHRVSVQSLAKGNSFVTQLDDIILDGSDQDVTLRLTQSEISGRVALADTGKPPAGPGMFVSVALYHLGPKKDGKGKVVGETIAGHAGNAFLDKEGGYAFRGVRSGRYRIYVHLRGYRKVERDLEVSGGETKTGVDFELEKLRAGTLEVTVKDEGEEPIGGLSFSYSSDGQIWSSLNMDRPSPGVYVTKQLDTGTWRVSMYRKDLASKRVEVKIEEGATTRLAVVMAPKQPR
jgi:protocatechuate 3,4-dioxygenase beta subunit